MLLLLNAHFYCSVLAALKTGSGTGNDVKEQVINRIQQKMLSEMYEYEQQNGDSEVPTVDSPAENGSQDMNGDSVTIEDEEAEENITPPANVPTNQNQPSRKRRKVKPSKYVPEIFTCERCTKQFEFQSQYIQHCCFKIDESGDETGGVSVDEPANDPPINAVAVSISDEAPIVGYTALDIEHGKDITALEQV